MRSAPVHPWLEDIHLQKITERGARTRRSVPCLSLCSSQHAVGEGGLLRGLRRGQNKGNRNSALVVLLESKWASTFKKCFDYYIFLLPGEVNRAIIKFHILWQGTGWLVHIVTVNKRTF